MSNSNNNNILNVIFLSDQCKDIMINQFNKRHTGDVGIDIPNLNEEVIIKSGVVNLIDLGVRVKLPTNTYGRLKARSSTGTKFNIGIIEGTIDAGYQGILKAQFINYTNKDISLNNDNCYVQLIVSPIVENIKIKPVVEFEDKTTREDKGFGSTSE